MAEWLKRRTVKPLGSAKRGLESYFRRFFIWFCGEMDSNLKFDSSNPSSKLRKKTVICKTLATTFFEI